MSKTIMGDNHMSNGTTAFVKLIYPDFLMGDFLNADYGNPEDVLIHGIGDTTALGMSQRAAQICIRHTKAQTQSNLPNRALDLGCGVGGSTFELASHFEKVLGLDRSVSFINVCNLLKQDGRLRYECSHEGDLKDTYMAVVNPDVDRSRIDFRPADALDLPGDLGQFGCILSSMLLDRVSDPRHLLSRFGDFLPSGGILVISCPYCVSTEFTNKEKWIGGFVDAKGKRVTNFEGMQLVLASSFELLEEHKLPCLQRRNAHLYEYLINHVTVWRKR